MDRFRQQTIVVVGGAGFVGSNLTRALLTHEPNTIIIVDNLLSSEETNIPSSRNIVFINGSITDQTVLDRLPRRLDYVFHLATYHGNQNSMHDPLADHANNTFTTLRLYDHLKDYSGIKKVVYASAGCTVAEKTYEQAHPTQEDAPVSLYLDSPYQISKVIGEFYSNYYFAHHNLPVVKARFQNVYGPGEILGAGLWRGTPATVWRNVIPTFIYRSLNGMPLTLENSGLSSRDFIYVEDIVRGLLLLAGDGKPGEVYNLASGIETTIMDLAKTIDNLTANTAPQQMLPRRNWDHSGKRFGSTEKTKRELGFVAEIPLLEGLTRTIAWTRENLSLIETCMQKHAEHMALSV